VTDADAAADRDRVDAVFLEAVRCTLPERAAFLDRACGGDTHLRAEVERLLRNDVDDAFLAHHAIGADPEWIGPYRILGELGAGGMGTVYLAEQREPVRRRVALKLIRHGMDSKAVLARFALERQVLAIMSHDAIAKVFDAGTSERGQPYFVMEFVEGMPITRHCDRHGLGRRARIALFQKVCAGVQHAHHKGVVHRDLKPGNVLCKLDGDEHTAKVIDFGIARATDQHLGGQSLFTEAGVVIGTPEYMSPEQASGDAMAIDTRTDVYSLGVMLYELLTGSLPFETHELRAAGPLEMLRKIREDEPVRPGTKVRGLAAELDWIVLKAIAKEPQRRYASPNDLAQDLDRHLSHQPVLAGPPGAAYRLRKLARRYRVQVIAGAIILAAVIAGGIGTSMQYLRAEAKADEFDQLAGMVLYDQAVAAEEELHPPWPHKVGAMETWLREDCGALLAMRNEIERTVARLRARALPQSEAEKQREQQTHPRFWESRNLAQWVASMRRAQAIRDGTALVVPELSAEQQMLDAGALNALAWDRVAPAPSERKIYGEEALGLAFARAAVALAKDTDRHELLDTLAWALLENGQVDEAKTCSARALAAAPAHEKQTYAGHQRDLEQAIANADRVLSRAEREHATLVAEIAARRTWKFPVQENASRFLHDTLVDLLQKLSLLEARKAAVEQRRAWARGIDVLTRAHPNARVSWEQARAAIAASQKYAGRTIALRECDVTGLVPIGENPATGLWEFYDLRSAWDGVADAASIAIPVHRPDGSIEVTGETGIVFVLLPGGTFTMGAQKEDPNDPNYDEQAESDESPVQEVRLSPFFLARHELTQGQWLRLTGSSPSYYAAGRTWAGDAVTGANPVEQVSWEDCDRWLARHGLVLPSEAQWEYGCRAGAATPWSCAFDELVHYANLGDATARRAVAAWTCEDWSDGHVVHAAVGTFKANAFGLHDMHGNVWEWTRDGNSFDAPRAGDGLRGDPAGSERRVDRGGSFMHPALPARSANRSAGVPGMRSGHLGVRPARVVSD
jgi:formylglycine-generating enzyme required for sulfatase activity/tRNA A-37 threonylcarbamoyl transferase component Bud32